MAIRNEHEESQKTDELIPIFNESLRNMLERFERFSESDEQLLFFSDMVLRTTFYSISTLNGVREFFNVQFIESSRGKKHSREMLDYLQSMMFEFRTRLKLRGGIDLRSVSTKIAAAYNEESQPGSGWSFKPNTFSVLPEDQQVPNAEANFQIVLEQNSWFYALVLTRLFGMGTLYQYVTIEDKREPRKPT